MMGLGEDLESLFNLVAVLLLISVPLGLWKLVEIIIWIYQHVSIMVAV